MRMMPLPAPGGWTPAAFRRSGAEAAAGGRCLARPGEGGERGTGGGREPAGGGQLRRALAAAATLPGSAARCGPGGGCGCAPGVPTGGAERTGDPPSASPCFGSRRGRAAPPRGEGLRPGDASGPGAEREGEGERPVPASGEREGFLFVRKPAWMLFFFIFGFFFGWFSFFFLFIFFSPWRTHNFPFPSRGITSLERLARAPCALGRCPAEVMGEEGPWGAGSPPAAPSPPLRGGPRGPPSPQCCLA